ncbi:TPA: peptidoglycan bridge formation glycyltransferase FemA/FemB family protein [Candidatus Saccharibacteria bacterium]|nr:peptidoglycan bridge formation glycyltransferase FemA/FemB family protein [Candidatus Saccharibacteria bacterium]HIO87803.1 peptidoglycan bridge formation glycyltransferase FemA/FemB family protein [Candidatus Saccharibacteria bacterium]
MAKPTQKNILNNSGYIRFKQAHGWEYQQLELNELPAANLCVRTMPGVGRVGMIQAYTNELNAKELGQFTKQLKQLNLQVVKVFFVQPFDKKTFKRLDDLGWKPANHPKVPRSVMILTLGKDFEETSTQFTKQGRYEARKGAKEEVVVEELEVNQPNYQRLLPLIEATYKRAGIHRSMKEKTRGWDEYAKDGSLRFFIAHAEGEDLACATLVRDADTAWYLDGGSVPYRNQLYATQVLQNAVIKAAQESGVKYYDFLGVTPKVVRETGKQHSMDGVTKFKQKFCSDFYDYIGVYELPIKTKNYAVFKKLERYYVAIFKRLTGKYWY